MSQPNQTVKLTGYTNTAFDGSGTKNCGKEDRPESRNVASSKLPINSSGLFSYIFITWITPLVWRMYRKRNDPVRQSEIWDCSEEEGVRRNTERIKSLWQDDVGNYGTEKASFYRVWVKFVWARTLAGLAIMTVYAVSCLLPSAVLVKLILSYMESPDDDVWYGLGLGGAVLISDVTRACSNTAAVVLSFQTGTRFRSGMNGLLYDKILKLKSLRGKSSEILNIFSVDSYRVYMNSFSIVYLLPVPIFIALGAVYCYVLIGYWVVLAMGTYAALIILQIKYMSEILKSMTFIKLYAWEQPFKNAVSAERAKEQKYLLYSAIIDAVASSVIPVAPTIASAITFAVYTAFGNDLTASTAFAVIGTTNFMRVITWILPYGLRLWGEARVSLDRIKDILIMEEYLPPSNKLLHEENAVELKEANFAWDNDEESTNESRCLDKKPTDTGEKTLAHITLEVEKGLLVGVCGAVGSGKSSLMSAILGRMQHLSGHLAVSGRIAYVAQQAWIFNGTFRENILFGLDYNENRYREVLSCCGLERDLQLFKYGDETEIGEHGINISGGQKQRVNLARAAYSNSDIYILDDPMSALDTTVGTHVFHSCIRGFLKNKTVLLVTHQLQYMCYCDEVVVLEKGKIVERGQHVELTKLNGIYSEMYQTFKRTAMKSRERQVSGSLEEAMENKTKYWSHNVTDAANGAAKPLTSGNEKGKLVQREETAVGTVTFSTYRAYIKAAGGWGVFVFVLVLYVVAAGSLVFTEWWLSLWIGSGLLTSGDAAMIAASANQTLTLNTSDMSQTEGLLTALDNDTFYLVYVVSFVGIVLFQIIKGCIGAKIAVNASNNLHSKCLDSVLKAPMSFFESNPAGRILNRFTRDLDESDVYIPNRSIAVLLVLCLVVVSFAMSSYITPWILIATGPVVIFMLFIKQVLAVSMRQIKRLENVARSPLISHVDLTLQGLPNITTYGQQHSFIMKFVQLGDVASMMSFLFDISTRWIGLRLDLLSVVLYVAASVIFVLNKGSIPAESAGLVFSLFGKTVAVLEIFITTMNELEGRFTSIERIQEYNKALVPESQHGSAPSSPGWPTEGAVEFRKVVMRYRTDLDPVLRSICFIVQPREKVGVVGRTGAGKTSLAVCLFRLVELQEGTILVDGEDVSKLSLSCLRSRISSIPQDPVLFNGNLRYNIDPFSNYSDGEIWEALEKVNMKQKIQQSDEKLHLMVEENGNNFSVGERQLICLARAVLRNNKILLLDEATANIDISTDAMIQDTIRTCFADCTVITIAHRLNTVLHSDKIIVMDDGQVIECDTPQELLSDRGSLLNKMLAAQSAKSQHT